MKLIFFFCLLFIFSCSAKQEIPKDILSQEKMEAVLWDMMRADDFVSIFERKDSTRTTKDKSTSLYQEVFRIHQTDRSQFEKSVNFYNLHPDLFKTVVDSLEKRKGNVSNEYYKPSHPADSLRTKFKHIPPPVKK
jgi:hypothetical protein